MPLPPPVANFVRANQKILGIVGFLLLIYSVTALSRPGFSSPTNLSYMLRDTGLFGILSIGVAMVIITGGIDLSIGSVVGLCGILLPTLIMPGSYGGKGLALIPSMLVIVGIALLIGLFHGILITKLRLQPFLVTLCGLFIYRGMAQVVGGNSSPGFRDQFTELKPALVMTKSMFPMSFVVLLIIAVIASLFLNRTVYGRYLLALGRNEEAARFSGINTDRMKIVAYMICSGLAGFAGMLFVINSNSATGSQLGNSYELYAIAGAVLGGCSLRGGQGALVGIVLGAALVQVIERVTLFVIEEDNYKYMVIGAFILFGVIMDELYTRYIKRRRALQVVS